METNNDLLNTDDYSQTSLLMFLDTYRPFAHAETSKLASGVETRSFLCFLQ